MRRFLPFVVLSLLSGCNEPPPPAPGASAGSVPWFHEEAVERGLMFVHASGAGPRPLFPEIVCGGAALFDMDGDGDLDAYLVQFGGVTVAPEDRPSNRLFRNDGAGRFTDVTEGSGADDRGLGMGVAAGDCDGDGDIDLYVTNLGPNVLLGNDGNGHFTDATDATGTGHAGFGASAAFLDSDGDGDLDLFVTNYVHWSPAAERDCYAVTGERDYCAPVAYEAPARDVLYRNEGVGHYTDVSDAAGLGAAFGNGLGVACADYDGDGRTDVYVANDGMPNQLWTNRGDGTFRDDAPRLGAALDQDGVAKAGMGVDAADVDGDHDLDLLVVNLGGENDSFYRRAGGHFVDDTPAVGLAGVTRRSTRFGVGLRDFDQDGYLDLFQVTGRVRRGPGAYAGGGTFAEPNFLLRGTAAGRFEEVRPRGGTEPALIATSRAAAFGDVDGDGAIDVLVVNRDGPAHLLMNRVPERGGWVRLRLVDRGVDAVGASVFVTIGDRRVRREVRPDGSYLASSDPAVHVGLGAFDRARDVTVRWADGTRERFGDQSSGSSSVLRRGSGTPEPSSPTAPSSIQRTSAAISSAGS